MDYAVWWTMRGSRRWSRLNTIPRTTPVELHGPDARLAIWPNELEADRWCAWRRTTHGSHNEYVSVPVGTDPNGHPDYRDHRRN